MQLPAEYDDSSADGDDEGSDCTDPNADADADQHSGDNNSVGHSSSGHSGRSATDYVMGQTSGSKLVDRYQHLFPACSLCAAVNVKFTYYFNVCAECDN